MALVIAGDRSGVGKTTVTLALLSYLSQQSKRVQSFKVGPDYIDPMFHTAVTGRPCRNLDPVLTSESYVQSCFSRHSQGVDYVLVEGVMGLFDGISPDWRLADERVSDRRELNFLFADFASTAHIARLLHLPILLVLDCSRLSTSVAAIVHGYRTLDPRINLVGIVLNRVASDRHLELLQDALRPLNLPILGVLRRSEQITIPDRHLGLVPTDEIGQLEIIFARLAHIAKTCFDWHHLLPLLQPTKNSSIVHSSFPLPHSPIKIAIARDRAFNFYYQDNLDILTQLGATLIPWSPLIEESLPDDIGGMYFGGGFPEVFARQLAENQLARHQVRQAIQSGIPTYAECGGLMYLCQQLVDFEGQVWPMVGVLPTTVIMSKNLTLGYRRVTALQDSPPIEIGQTFWGHEFHRSQLTSSPLKPLWQIKGYKSNTRTSTEGWQLRQLHGSYIHLHFGECQNLPKRFFQYCYRQRDPL
ncbi:cobyrinate a,c-diamide synthase [Pleurocapsales cyanobacterium LEGE 06147]|nr:cobyrinate a,c-diamide synthase [Pleurocapsales cyanobacterium LEGE 06147]